MVDSTPSLPGQTYSARQRRLVGRGRRELASLGSRCVYSVGECCVHGIMQGEVIDDERVAVEAIVAVLGSAGFACSRLASYGTDWQLHGVVLAGFRYTPSCTAAFTNNSISRRTSFFFIVSFPLFVCFASHPAHSGSHRTPYSASCVNSSTRLCTQMQLCRENFSWSVQSQES